LNNDLLESFKSRLSNLDWKKAIVLIVAIFMSIYSNYLNLFSYSFIIFLFGSGLSFVLFVLKNKFWKYIFTVLLVLNFFDIIEFNYYSTYIGINSLRINIIPFLFVFVHIFLNTESLDKYDDKNYFSFFYKSEKAVKDDYKSRVERFEFKYRYKSIKQLNEIIEDKGVMTKEAVQAAVNLIDKFDMG